MVVFDDGRLHVHRALLSAESQYFDAMFKRDLGNKGIFEVDLQYVPIHAAWRTLSLIYSRSYTVAAAPSVSKADNDNELTRHARVYQLARYWGLSKNLQNLSFHHFGQALQEDWELEDILLTLSILLHPTFPGYFKVFSDVDLHEDRMVKLILKTLPENLKEADKLFLKLYLDLSPFRHMIQKSFPELD
ncbi:hypothetical protein BDV06DRAFT_228452 [Aspergillus oleicola]